MSTRLASPEQDKSDIPAEALTSKYAKLSFRDIELLVRMHNDGRTQVDIATVLQCSQSTVSMHLARLKETPDTVKALLKSDTAGVVSNWRRAARIAARRGDHRPAREWLEAAHPELRPQPATSGPGGGVTINIGMPGQPISLPALDVTASTQQPARLSPPLSEDLHKLSD